MAVAGAGASHDREARIHELALTFRDYLTGQTGIELPAPDELSSGAASDPHGPAAVLAAVERLDHALAQLIDLTSIYTDHAAPSLEPLALPTAALLGAYLRAALGAHWLASDALDDEQLVLAFPDGVAVDLGQVARSALLSGAPHFTAVVAPLVAG